MSNTLDVRKIQDGLDDLQKLGHREDTFEVLDRSFTIRTIKREELEAANRRCQPLFKEAQETEDTFSLSNWLQAVKIETLSYAIMKIGDIDFHGIDYIKTGEVDQETGQETRVQKHVFIRDLIRDWEDSVIDTLYSKFQELTERAETEAREDVEFQEDDKEARIEELEEDIRRLKAERGDEEATSTRGPSELNEDEVDRDALKDEVFSAVEEDFQREKSSSDARPQEMQSEPTRPSPADPQTQAPQRQRNERSTQTQSHGPDAAETEGGYAYAEQEPQEDMGPPSGQQEPSSQQPPAPAQTQEPSRAEAEYVDEEGNPLEGEALEIAKQQDRLFRRRQQQKEDQDEQQSQPSEAEALRQKRRGEASQQRQPMNQVDADIKEGQLNQPHHPSERPTVNAQKARNDEDVSDLPIADGFSSEMGPEKLEPSEEVEWNEDEVNNNPHEDTNINPNFQPHNKNN